MNFPEESDCYLFASNTFIITALIVISSIEFSKLSSIIETLKIFTKCKRLLKNTFKCSESNNEIDY